jgi:hypothetical protein
MSGGTVASLWAFIAFLCVCAGMLVVFIIILGKQEGAYRVLIV